MSGPTPKQREILDFIQKASNERGAPPTFQEIAAHFGFRSLNSVTEHVRLLRQKGLVSYEPGLARSIRVLSPLTKLRREVVDIPVFGSIPAGFAEHSEEEAIGCVSADVGTIGVRANAHTFALEVKGDSMIGRHILSGDTVVVEHGKSPRPGDIVAALIDGESTLKTYRMQHGKLLLHAENPRYPDLMPANELVIQGVMVALIRKGKALVLVLLLSGLVFATTCKLFSPC